MKKIIALMSMVFMMSLSTLFASTGPIGNVGKCASIIADAGLNASEGLDGSNHLFNHTENMNTNSYFSPALAAPEIIEPALTTPKASLDQPIALTLKWSSVSGATKYKVQVSTDSTFADVSKILIDQFSAPGDTTMNITGLAFYSFHYARVYAVNVGTGQQSDWSTLRYILTKFGPPVLVSPSNNGTGTSIHPLLAWRAVVDAPGYTYEIYSDAALTNLIFAETLIAWEGNENDTSVIVSVPLNVTGKYYWRVRAGNIVTNGYFSEPFSFSPAVAAPVPVHPIAPYECCISIDDAIIWNASNGATKYGIKFSDKRDFSTVIYDGETGTNGTETSWSFKQLKNDATHYYQLRCFDGSQWIYGAVDSFTTVLPQVPALNYPAEGNIVYTQKPIFSWSYPSGSTGLTSTIQIATNSNFTTGLQSATTTSSPYTWGTALPLGQQFWWRVICSNSHGTVFSYSAANHFTIFGSVSVPVATWPVNGAKVYTNKPTIYWCAPNGTAGSTFMHGHRKVGAGTWDRAVAWTASLSDELPELEPNTTYEWCVKTFNGYDSSAYTEPETFVTNGSGTLVVPTASWPVTWGTTPTVYSCSPSVNWYTGTSTIGLTFEVGYGEDANPANWTAPFIAVPAGLSAVIPNLSCGHTYYWAVRSVNNSGHSAWSSSPQGKFTVFGSIASIKPTCSYPKDDAVVYNVRPTLGWYSASSSINYYLIHYNLGSGWVDVPTHILSQSWTFDFDLLNGTNYQWFVTAVNLSGESSNSDVASFKTTGFAGDVYPIISSPLDKMLSLTNNPTLNWFVQNPWLTALKFRVQVSSDPLFIVGIVYDTAGITSTSKVVYGNVNSGCVYYWRVCGSVDGGLTYGTWSTPIGSFTTWAGNKPVVVIPAGPSNNIVVNTTSPDLGWYQPVQSESALTYNLQYSTDKTFTSAVSVNDLTVPMYRANNLSQGIKYYWRVNSKTSDGTTSQYSNVAEFIPANATAVKPEVKVPTAFSLSQNYPNPFNPSTSISFSLAEKSNVTLTVYNQLGQKVAMLVNGEKEVGFHNVTWNASNMISGIYFYELKTEKFRSVKKLILMK